jgi:histidinol dehydrogenase
MKREMTDSQKYQILDGLDLIMKACGHPPMSQLLNSMSDRIPDSNIMKHAVEEIINEVTGSLANTFDDYKAAFDKVSNDPAKIQVLKDKYKAAYEVKPIVEQDTLEVPKVVGDTNGSVNIEHSS